MMTILSGWRHTYLGHATRMNDSRIPKQVLYGELLAERRPYSRPKRRYQVICKSSMPGLPISHEVCEEPAKERVMWRGTSCKGAASCEDRIMAEVKMRKLKGKETGQILLAAATVTDCSDLTFLEFAMRGAQLSKIMLAFVCFNTFL